MMRLIDADVLIEKFKTDKFTHVRNEYQSGYNDGLFHAEVVADNMPTVDAVPVRYGKWVETEFLKLRECSCCHVRWGMYDTEGFKYCPNCGARMVEDE